MNKHSHSERHIKSFGDWMAFKSHENSNTAISYKLNAARNDEVQENRTHVKLLFRATSFLARQGIAFRGHGNSHNKDGDEIKNKGNYIELLESYAQDNPVLKQKLEKRYVY